VENAPGICPFDDFVEHQADSRGRVQSVAVKLDQVRLAFIEF